MIFSLKDATRSISSYPLKHFPISLPLNFSEVNYFTLNDHFYRISSLSSLQWEFLYRLPRYFGLVFINWATCSDSTFLGNHDPKCREVATATVGSGLRMLPHVSLLSTQSPQPTWPVNTLLTALLSCCLLIYLFINKIFWIYIKYYWPHWSPITT